MSLPSPTSATTPDPSVRVRWRALIVGVSLAVLVNGFDPVSRYLIHSSSFTRSYIPFAVLLGLLFLAYGVNPVLKRWRASWSLTHHDLAGVLAIGVFAGTIPNLAHYLVAAISAPDYFASPENEWPTYTLPNLQRWLVPSNEGGGVEAFYRGLVQGGSFPWDTWAGPLFWWISALVAIMAACLCTAVILRKQWSENERLSYPLVEVPLLLIEEPPPGRMLPAFFGEKRFWIGFSIPAFMLLWNSISYFYLGFPTFAFVNTYTLLPLGRGFLDLYCRFDFYVICFAYFTPLNILLSMWGFHLLATLQSGISTRIGFGPQGYGAGVISQNNYGLLVFVLWGVWMARKHLKDVWDKAIGRASHVDDSHELLSYRTAAFGLIAAVVYLFFWLCATNMSPIVAATFMFFTAVLYLGMAKIVALSGLVSLRASGPTGVTKGLVGIRNMNDITIAALNQMGAFYGSARGFTMPGAAHAAKASEHGDPSRQRLGTAVFIGGVFALLSIIGVTLLLGYFGPGAENFGDGNYTRWNRSFYNYTVSNIKDRSAVREWWNFGFGLFGAAATMLLIFLNQRLPWWPLHPVGFTVSLQWPTRGSFLSIFIAWLFKTIVLRIGGIELYQRTRITIIGALLGYIFGVTVAFLLDLFFFFGQGHVIHVPP